MAIEIGDFVARSFYRGGLIAGTVVERLGPYYIVERTTEEYNQTTRTWMPKVVRQVLPLSLVNPWSEASRSRFALVKPKIQST